jgi:hypothetical protein
VSTAINHRSFDNVAWQQQVVKDTTVSWEIVAENQVLNKYSGTGPLYKYLRNETSATEFADHNTELADQVLVMTKVAMHDTSSLLLKLSSSAPMTQSPGRSRSSRASQTVGS